MGVYLSHIADEMLQKALRASGSVLIEGLKWCVKTRKAQETAKNALLFPVILQGTTRFHYREKNGIGIRCRTGIERWNLGCR